MKFNRTLKSIMTLAVVFSGFSVLAQNNNLKDGQIAKIAKDVDQAEINEAKLAQSKSSNKEVKDFAQHMIQEHGKNMDKQKDVAKGMRMENSELSKKMQQDAQEGLKKLKSAKATDFDRVYMQSQVADHKKVLKELDQTLIPNAKDSNLKAFLQQTRDHVQQHLSQAEKIESSLSNQNQKSGGSQ